MLKPYAYMVLLYNVRTFFLYLSKTLSPSVFLVAISSLVREEYCLYEIPVCCLDIQDLCHSPPSSSRFVTTPLLCSLYPQSPPNHSRIQTVLPGSACLSDWERQYSRATVQCSTVFQQSTILCTVVHFRMIQFSKLICTAVEYKSVHCS